MSAVLAEVAQPQAGRTLDARSGQTWGRVAVPGNARAARRVRPHQGRALPGLPGSAWARQTCEAGNALPSFTFIPGRSS